MGRDAWRRSTGRWIVAGIVLFLFFILKRVLAYGVLGGLRRVAHQHKHSTLANVLDAFALPMQMFVMLLGRICGRVAGLFRTGGQCPVELISIIATFSIFWALFRAVEPLALSFNNLIGRFGAGLGDDLRQFFIRGVKTLIAVIFGVVLLEDWGIDVSAFLGGLGLAGMAVALAAKDSIANIFGGLTILPTTFTSGATGSKRPSSKARSKWSACVPPRCGPLPRRW